MNQSLQADIIVVGAGVHGVCISRWLSELYDCRILLIDMAAAPGMHTSARNTGVLHRPFYLNPKTKRVFAATSLVSFQLWKELSSQNGLPWSPVGTLNVAATEEDVVSLEQYQRWGVMNGMQEEELELLDSGQARSLEREVECKAALHCRTDVSVDYGAYTRTLLLASSRNGVTFFGNSRVVRVSQVKEGVQVSLVQSYGLKTEVIGKLLINAAGGGALELAHRMGAASDYSALNFRGEYWVVDEPFASRVTRNVYRPPRHSKFPFLDPHFVVRADGERQIGPNATLVTGPYVYTGFGLGDAPSLLSPPIGPKLRLLSDREFIHLVASEWKSSLSKNDMCGRVNRFIPNLSPEMLKRRAVFGVRSSVVGRGGFVPESLLLLGERYAHVLNYNSPGATGAPAHGALVVASIRKKGLLDGLHVKQSRRTTGAWNFEEVIRSLPEQTTVE